jgi:hypothetical protein
MKILKNTANTVPLTLTEKATTGSQDWLFEFTSDDTGEVKYCHATDISLYPARYNEFMITDSATEDAQNGTLDFSPVGTWRYRIYEMPVSSPPSLTPTGYLAIVETGQVKVIDPSATSDAKFDDDETKDIATFDQ